MGELDALSRAQAFSSQARHAPVWRACFVMENPAWVQKAAGPAR